MDVSNPPESTILKSQIQTYSRKRETSGEKIQY
jgi:hypothetical protein